MANPITAVSLKEVYNVANAGDGITQMRIDGLNESKGIAMLSYKTGDFWLGGHWLPLSAVLTYLTKHGATLHIEEPKVTEEATAKKDKVDLKAIVVEFLTDKSVATTVEVAKHLGKPTAVANSVLCALERRELVSSKSMESGITWKLKKKN